MYRDAPLTQYVCCCAGVGGSFGTAPAGVLQQEVLHWRSLCLSCGQGSCQTPCSYTATSICQRNLKRLWNSACGCCGRCPWCHARHGPRGCRATGSATTATEGARAGSQANCSTGAEAGVQQAAGQGQSLTQWTCSEVEESIYADLKLMSMMDELSFSGQSSMMLDTTCCNALGLVHCCMTSWPREHWVLARTLALKT